MKKLFLALALVLVCTLSASAQFEKGKFYTGINLNGIGLSYSKATDFSFGLGANAGYFVADNWLVLGEIGMNYTNKSMANLCVGAKGRYIFESCGVFVQAGMKYAHTAGLNDFQITPEVGWTFFLNRHLTLEPSAYVDISTCHINDLTNFGIKLGLGWYFDRKLK